MPKVNNRPRGENSPNPVTLAAANDRPPRHKQINFMVMQFLFASAKDLFGAIKRFMFIFYKVFVCEELVEPLTSSLHHRRDASKQGCQMAHFQTKTTNLGKFLRALKRKMLVYVMVIWSILRPFGIFCRHLV
jgi:hypothetical protein